MNKGFCEIPIDKLVKAHWNYKENNQELAEKLANNIKRNGQIENIIVRELETGFYEVVNGNHRLDVLKELGFESVHSFNLGKISDASAQRIAIETNETKFASNISKLENILLEISNEFDFSDISLTMPFSEEYLSGIIDKEDIDIDSFFSEEKTDAEQKDKELLCPHCGKNIYEETS